MQRWFTRLFGSRVRLLETQLAIVNQDLHDLGQAHARIQAQLEQAKKHEAYWQQRAEKLIDSALARANAISEPVMAAGQLSELERVSRNIRSAGSGLAMTSFPSKA